jgi:hypothetical protein
MKHMRKSIVITIIAILIVTVFSFTSKPVAANTTYIIESNDQGTYNIINGLTNQVIYTNTDGKRTIECALAQLTPDRTWKETVILRGNISGVHEVEIPSYTRIIGEGANLYLDSNTSLFEIPPSENNTVDVEIQGINFIGSSIASDTALQMYRVVNGSYIGVENLILKLNRFTNFSTGLYLFSIGSQITGNTFSNCKHSIIIANDHGSIISNNFFCLGNNETTTYGLQVLDSNGLKIVNNDFSVIDAGDTVGIVCDAQFIDSVISGNTFNRISRASISFGATERPSDYLIFNNVVSDNTFSDMETGVALEVGYVTPVDTLSISGNTFRNIDLVLRIGGGGATSPSNNVLVTNNIASGVNRLCSFDCHSCNAAVVGNFVNGQWIP